MEKAFKRVMKQTEKRLSKPIILEKMRGSEFNSPQIEAPKLKIKKLSK